MRRTAALALALLAACAHQPDPHAGTAAGDSSPNAAHSADASPSASAPSTMPTDTPPRAGTNPGRSGAKPNPGVHVPGPTDINTGDATAGDSSRVNRLEAEARALARADGCTQASQCRVAPAGDRACGGPRTYVAYCAASTDSAPLFAKLNELKRAENDYHQRHGTISTCEYRTPPAVALRGGRCVASAPGARADVP